MSLGFYEYSLRATGIHTEHTFETAHIINLIIINDGWEKRRRKWYTSSS